MSAPKSYNAPPPSDWKSSLNMAGAAAIPVPGNVLGLNVGQACIARDEMIPMGGLTYDAVGGGIFFGPPGWVQQCNALQRTNVLDEANKLVHGERQAHYGHPLDDFSRTAKIWSAILGIEIRAEQVALCMVGVKISRQCNGQRLDNLIDGAGYFETLNMVINERASRNGVAGTSA